MEQRGKYIPVSPTGCLDLLWPALTAFPITEEARAHLQQKAKALPPVPRLALELRLNQSAESPDLHQMAKLQTQDRDVFDAWASTNPHMIDSERFVCFLNDLLDDDAPEHIYFEWDHAHLQDLPAVFLPMDDQCGMRDDSVQRAKRLDMLKQLAGWAGDLTVPSSLEDAHISHIGLMPSRGDLVRVNLRRVLPQEFSNLLQKISWPGDHAAASMLFETLVNTADKVTVALNLRNGEVTGYIGFEVLLQQPPATEPRWRMVFDTLQSLSLCTEEEAACLLQLPRTLVPYHRDVSWPAPWMVAAELYGSTSVPKAELGLSHMKVSVGDDGVLSAKAYVSAQHEWSGYDAVRIPRTSDRSATEAIHAAVHFLMQQRQQNGWWREFTTPLGASEEWVSAFVGCALLMTNHPEARMASDDVLRILLLQQRENGGWGYNAFTAADADATLWVLRLMEALEYNGDSRDRALAFVKHHVTEQGVQTFSKLTPMLFGSQSALADPSGWQSAHDCVTANALPFVDLSCKQRFVARQQDDGAWTPYWWWTPALTTALAAEALHADSCHAESVQRAVAWARTYVPSSPSCFVEAFRLRILLLGEEADHTHANTRAQMLRASQRDDGSWPADCDLRFPHAHETRGASADSVPLERIGVFTTAAVLMALLRLEAQQ